MMTHMLAIFKKQVLDTFKNKTVLIQFVLFPLMTVVMTQSVHIDGMPENYFVVLFASMYVAMAPLTAMSAILAEEKEKNTLRVLLMSHVRPHEYLVGAGTCIVFFCFLGSGVICACGHYEAHERVIFLAVMVAGTLISLIIGASIGLIGKSQMAATSLAVPVMCLLAFLPMLSLFNDTISRFARFFYSEQIRRLLENPGRDVFKTDTCVILAANLALTVCIFTLAYRRNRMM